MKYIAFVVLLFWHLSTFGQSKVIDSLSLLLKKATTDTARIKLENSICNSILENDIDSGIRYLNRIIENAKQIHYAKGEAVAHRLLAVGLSRKSDFAAAKAEANRAEKLFQSGPNPEEMAKVYATYGLIYGMQSKYDSSIFFYKKSLAYAEQLPDKTQATRSYQNIAISYQMQSDFRQAIFYQTKALQNSEAAHDTNNLAYLSVNMAITYENLNDKTKPKQLYLKGIEYAKIAGIKNVELYAYSNLASLYSKEKNNGKSYEYAMKAVNLGKQIGDPAITASALSAAAVALSEEKHFTKAEELNNEAILLADSTGQPLNKFQTLAAGGYIKKLQGEYRKAIVFYEKGFAFMQDADLYSVETMEAYKNLSECYEETGNFAKALTDFKLAAKISDSVSSRENVRKATELSMNYEFDKKQEAQQTEKERQDNENKIKQTFLIAFLLVFITMFIVSFIYYNRERNAKSLVNVQKKEVESTLSQLKMTQTQLIQSEKMASLGELTAGIAHEIQNPLNFVNNFSEVSKEMLEELKAERLKPKAERDEALEEDLINNVIVNEEKINHHGKRADAIVKGMLQHSRQTSGTKELTDINALCDEYLRLSYHGLRAKDKSFNADFKTHFDESIGKINIVPQDMGRVLLNLFNNAFYAVSKPPSLKGEQYKPLITVTTKKIKVANNNAAANSPLGDGGIEITVTDNGSGIPPNVIDKIFQPFFTTKPTGEGTGLGLSLSYDVITKQHNGTIEVRSKEKEGTAFIILLPVI